MKSVAILAVLLSCICVVQFAEGTGKLTCGFEPWAVVNKSKYPNYQAPTLSEIDFSICDEIILSARIKYNLENKGFYSNTDPGVAGQYDAMIEEFCSDTFGSGKIKLISFGRDHSIGTDTKDNYKIYLAILTDPDFVTKAVAYAQDHKLSGLVMNYDIEGDNDKVTFQTFMTTLRTAFNEKGLLLYLTVGTDRHKKDDDNEWLKLEQSVDVLLLQTCYPTLDEMATAIFPIEFVYPSTTTDSKGCIGDECSVDGMYNYLVTKIGLDGGKISIEIQHDCLVVHLNQGSENCVGTSTITDITGPVWGTKAYTTFDEMCLAKKDKCLTSDAISSCVDRTLAGEIAKYVQDKGMYGVYIAGLNYDDPLQYCACGEAYPITHTVRAVLDGSAPNTNDCLYGGENPFTKLADQCCPPKT